MSAEPEAIAAAAPVKARVAVAYAALIFSTPRGSFLYWFIMFAVSVE